MANSSAVIRTRGSVFTEARKWPERAEARNGSALPLSVLACACLKSFNECEVGSAELIGIADRDVTSIC
jgi:hypothetical protein